MYLITVFDSPKRLGSAYEADIIEEAGKTKRVIAKLSAMEKLNGCHHNCSRKHNFLKMTFSVEVNDFNSNQIVTELNLIKIFQPYPYLTL